jgi:hypothetical protein
MSVLRFKANEYRSNLEVTSGNKLERQLEVSPTTTKTRFFGKRQRSS